MEMKTEPLTENSVLIDGAITWLSRALPSDWTVEKGSHRLSAVDDSLGAPTSGDAAIEVRAPNGVYVTFAVETKSALSPRDVEPLLTGFSGTLRNLAHHIPLLVVARWLSPRSQELLEQNGINFVDLTGNALLRLDNPAVYIRSAGKSRDPQPRSRGQIRLRGAKAARVVRLLADVRPPYGVRDVAAATGVALSYVSRLLDALYQEALVERPKRGRIESVDVPRLIRRWAEAYDVFRTNDATTFLAPDGALGTLERLRNMPDAGAVAISGSFAAVRLAPVAAPALLVAYSQDIEATAKNLDLLPAAEGANVVLLRPYDSVVWERTADDRGLRFVAPSQVAVDSLTGNGRMPAEGEGLLTWMTKDESRWRLSSIEDVAREIES